MPCSTRFEIHARRQTSLRNAVFRMRGIEDAAADADAADEDEDNDDDDADSSANEYAEGLGCADRKRCREQPTSGFEFDSHPREEYFSQPAPDHDATGRKSAIVQVPAAFSVAKRRVLSAHDSSSLTGSGALPLALLKELERQECRATAAAGSGLRFPQHHSLQNVEASDAANSGHPNRNTIAMVQGLCAQLVELRTPAAAGSADAGAAGDGHRALAILAALECIRINVVLLRETGIGKELSLAVWRQNSNLDVASRSVALVSKWRMVVRAQRSSSTRGV